MSKIKTIEDLISETRKASMCIHIAVEQKAAEDISRIFRELATIKSAEALL